MRFESQPEAWIDAQSVSDAPVRWVSERDAEEYLDDCVAFLRSPSAGELDPALARGTMRSISWNLSTILADGTGSLTQRIASVELAGRWLVDRYPGSSGDDPVLFHFWEPITSIPAPSVWRDSAPLFDALFATLRSLLNSGNRYLQFSALRGLNYLRHPRTAEALEPFIARTDDDEVRAYATLVRRFEGG